MNKSILWKYKYTLKGFLSFEVRSFLGRMFFDQKPRLKLEGKNLLNLGCGPTRFKDFINADFFVFRNSAKPDWMVDLRYPLNCDDDVWDGVFTEHTLEHLYPDQAYSLLRELHRTMKPSAWIRITVPDLSKYIDFYNGKPVDQKFHQWETGCEGIRSLTQNHFHLSLWDFKLLKSYLSAIGFVNIQKFEFAQGTTSLLLRESEDRAWETLYVEAQKP
jgi:predicted SAM-dependent methyltransferase